MSVIAFKKTDLAPEQEQAEAPRRKVVIAVDGPSASGKGTLAKMLADRLGYAYLDTGALYRAVALATLEMNGDPSQYIDVEPALEIVLRNLTPELLANPALRSHAVSEAASQVAALPDVRMHLLDYQREFAKNPPGHAGGIGNNDVGGAVLDGRDIGTVICPEADLKLFVTATAEERARRRFEELKIRDTRLTMEQVLQDIQQRDQRDSTRKIAPTRAAEGAYVLDTTTMPPADVLEEAIAVLRSKFLEEAKIQL